MDKILVVSIEDQTSSYILLSKNTKSYEGLTHFNCMKTGKDEEVSEDHKV